MSRYQHLSSWIRLLSRPSFYGHHLSEEIEQTRFEQLYQKAPQHIVGGLVAALLVGLIYVDNTDTTALIVWGILNVLLLVLVSSYYWFSRHYPEKLNPRRRSIAAVVTLSCWGCVWALAPHLFLHNVEPANVFLLVLLIIALCTTPATTLALYPSSYYCFITPILLSLTLFTVNYDIGLSPLISLLPLILWISLIIYGYNLHGSLIKLIRLRLEKEQALRDANMANISKSRFFAAASHDIRQPLQAVHFFATALSQEVNTDNGRQLVQKLQHSADSMSLILDTLLDISRLDRHAVSVDRQAVALKPIIDKLIAQLQPEAQKKQLQLEAHHIDVTVISDPTLLQRILANLLSNAIRYTEAGSVEVSTNVVDKTISLSIADTGIGIPKAEWEAIFSEFYQIAGTSRDQQKGLGLGLSIVKRLVDLLDHSITIDSTCVPAKNHGTRFTIGIPLGNPNQLTNPIPTKAALPWELDNVRVLVIDDQQSIRDALSQVLLNWGCEVEVAASQEEALNIVGVLDGDAKDNTNAARWRPELIIADYSLADGTTGPQTIAKINQQLGVQIPSVQIPSVIITGDTNTETLEDIKRQHFLMLRKPIQALQLRATLQQLLRKRDASR